jgi:hypothetical protein
VPPLIGVAVNVALAPSHCGFVPAVNAMETEGVTVGLTVIVIPEEVAVVGLAQAWFDVITQVTVCPLVNALVVNAALLIPAFVPFTFH